MGLPCHCAELYFRQYSLSCADHNVLGALTEITAVQKKKERKEKQDFRTTEPTHLGRAAQVRIQQMLHGEITSYCFMGEHCGVRK